jgi:hypothetical protein
MQTVIYGAVAVAVALVVAGGVILGRRKRRPPRLELERFNFDKNKSYEKDGRKFPFSY